MATVNREEKIIIRDADNVARRKQIVRNVGAAQRLATAKVTRIIWLLFGLLEMFIATRVILKLLGANPNNTFANFVYDLTSLFLWPFNGLLSSPSNGDMVLEVSSIIAMVVYLVAAYAITRLIWIAFYRPNERVVTTYEEVE